MKKETDMRIEQQIAGISHSVGKEMACSSHTLTSCLGKLRSSLETGRSNLEYGKKYVCSVAEVLLYFSSSSFCVPSVLQWSPFDDLEMARNGFGDVLELYCSINMGGKACDVGIAIQCINVCRPIDLCSFSKVSNHPLEFLDGIFVQKFIEHSKPIRFDSQRTSL